MKSDRELELEKELELSLLQIDQLLEELEHYHLECIRLKEQEAKMPSASSRTPAQVLLSESRDNDPEYFESELYEKGKYLPARVSQLKQALESSTKEKVIAQTERDKEKRRAEILQCRVERLGIENKKALVNLDHLRDSYAVKVASEQELVELVTELRAKLTLASRYFIDLQKEHPEILLPIENT